MPDGLVVTGPELYSSCEMDTAPGHTAQPVSLSNTGGMPTSIAPPTGTKNNIEAPPINKTSNAPIHAPCQRFITISHPRPFNARDSPNQTRAHRPASDNT